MSYPATVLNVMIASPSDVPQERLIARDVISEWNAIHAKDKQIVLMPVGWETHASPDTGDRPQAIINGQLLKEADLLMAVFWTRLGRPTGVAPSGTVEEIEEHIKTGKPAMIYFSLAPVHPSSIDNDQYSALKAFKSGLATRGLYSDYESLSDFREKFSRHLAQTIISKFSPKNKSEKWSMGISEGTSHSVTHSASETYGRSKTTGTSESMGGDSVRGSNVSRSSGVSWSMSRSVPELSGPARELLLEAARDKQGVVMSLQTMEGVIVQANGREFVDKGDARSQALWRGAVKELSQLRLVEDRGGKGEVFFVTDEGYRVAERLKQQ